MDIWSLKKQGYSDSAIGRKVGLDRRTVKKYLENKEFPRYSAVNRKSDLEQYHRLIEDWLSQENYQATRIHDLVVLQGYEGSYDTVKRFVRQVKERRDRVAYVRFETVPGLQAQVDFGDFKVTDSAGNETTVYAFVMVLGFSRHKYVEFIDRCTMTTFLDCHCNAFGYFGGVVGEILYDNMKNVVIRRYVGGVDFNKTFLDFAAHYGFKPVACPPYSPWVKGKVERPMDFIRERFWRGYHYTTLEQGNRDMRQWLETVSNRIHGTTKQKVIDRFATEKTILGEIPNRPYDTSEKVARKVYKDCQLSFDGNRYLVPHQYVGKKVLLKIKNGKVGIFYDEKFLVAYVIPQGKGELVGDERFYKALKEDREQAKRKYRVPRGGKGKATRGLLKDGLRYEKVQQRPVADYEELVGGAPCLN
ncbi:MAG: IS21 family transposase [bacterium]